MHRVVFPMVAVWLAWSPVHALADVEIAGIGNSLEANVRAHLGLFDLGCDSPPWLVRWQFRDADADVAEALEALGYYDSRVTKSLTFPDSGCWLATIEISAGEPVVIAKLEAQIDGSLANEPAMIHAMQLADDLRGRPLNHDEYERLKRSLMDIARGLGYFDAVVRRSDVEVRTTERKAAIHIHIDGGERHRFGAITVTDDLLNQRLLDAYVPFNEGDFYSAELIAQLRRNLADSGYFAQVVVVADTEAADSLVVPVKIELTRAERSWTYSVGLGYATDTGPRLRGDAESRRLNRRGHRAAVRTLVSEVRSTLDAEYRIPHKDPLNDWFVFDAGVAHEDTDTSTSDIMRIGARHSYLRWGWVESDFVELTTEDFEIADTNAETRLVLLGTTISRTWRDDPVRPQRGLRLNATIRGALQDLGSDTTFLQIRGAAKVVRGLTDTTRVLARAEAGWTWKDEFNDLPPSVRFFAGGDTSIRGYEYQSIGPEQDGEVVGGSGLATGSLEFDWAFRRGWSAAAFIDTGSAFDREPEMVTGVGVGLRWYSPLGPVRLDLAHPLDEGKSGVRIHVTIGPDL